MIVGVVALALVFGTYGVSHAFVPNDPEYGNQWYLDRIRATEAWDITFGKQVTVVAVIDTGINVNHPDINFWRNSDEIAGDGIDNDNNGYVDDTQGWNFLDESPDVLPDLSKVTSENKDVVHHGTIVAGLAGAIPNNNEGISGVGWKTEIMPLKIADVGGTTTTSYVSKAVRYAVDNGARVINISLVSTDNVYDENFQEAVEYAYKNNVVVVAAAGNGSEDVAPFGFNLNQQPVYPACFTGKKGEDIVIGVGATDRNDDKASFTNYGYDCLEVSAPGTEIYSTLVTDTEGKVGSKLYGGLWYGTSFAAPLVSGSVAYMLSINPDLTVDQVNSLLKNTGASLRISEPQARGELGVGLDLAALVQAVYTNIDPDVNQEQAIETPTTTLQQDEKVVHIINKVSTDPLKFFGSTNYGGKPEVMVFDGDFNRLNSFSAYNTWETDGVRIGYLSAGSSVGSVVVAPGKGAAPRVRLYTSTGILMQEFMAYAPTFKGGVQLTTGDVVGDEQDDIIVAPESSGGPHIRIFNKLGELQSQFFAHDKDYRGGLQIAAGDVNKDGKDEIIVALGQGHAPLVKVFTSSGELLSEFLAYGENFRGGINLAAADVTGDGFDNIITGARKTGGPHIRIFNMKGSVQQQFFAYNKAYRDGVFVSTSDIDRDGVSEIIISNQTGRSDVKIFSASGIVKKVFSLGDRLKGNGNIILGN